MKEARVRYLIDPLGKETYVLEVKDGEEWKRQETFNLKEKNGEYEYLDCSILLSIMLLQEKGYSIKISY